ncbi:MAG: nitrogenase-stabilizing/protective protein NifW [bacterium]|nr:nitrogenase-stabilizing/protective protein NifW [bacterium]
MSVMEDLQELDSAEAYFEYFELPFDEDRLNVIRLHLLKLYRSKLSVVPQDLGEEEMYQAAKSALAQAWCEQSKEDAPKAFEVTGPCMGCNTGCSTETSNFAAMDVFDKFA